MTPDMIRFADATFRAEVSAMESLVERHVEHWQVHCGDLCPGDWCAGPLVDGVLESMDADQLRAQLQAAVWYLAKLRTQPGP